MGRHLILVAMRQPPNLVPCFSQPGLGKALIFRSITNYNPSKTLNPRQETHQLNKQHFNCMYPANSSNRVEVI